MVKPGKVFPTGMYSMNAVQYHPHITELSDCILNMLGAVDLLLVLRNTSSGIYLVLRKSKYTVVFLSINNETRCVPSPLL